MSALDRWLHEGFLRPLDHALGATLQRLDAATPDSVALAAALASRAVASGHSVLPLDRVGDLLAEIAPDRAAPVLPAVDAWRAALASSPFATRNVDDTHGRVLVVDGDRIALARYHDYEVRLARALDRLAGDVDPRIAPASLRTRLVRLFPSLAHKDEGPQGSLFPEPGRGGEPDRQALAAVVAQLRRVLLLTGGPGTGKTTTVARMLALRFDLAREHGTTLRVALAAPTGKAAARLQQE